MISVSIVDDEKSLCESIATFLNGSPGFRCVSMYGSAEAALKRLPAERPDVVLMDINMAGMNGIECVSQLKALVPAIQIVMLTVYDDTDQIFKALAAGATGYLLKRDNPEELLQAIRDVQDGGFLSESRPGRRSAGAAFPAGAGGVGLPGPGPGLQADWRPTRDQHQHHPHASPAHLREIARPVADRSRGQIPPPLKAAVFIALLSRPAALKLPGR
jgi:CheY-like chemotaxis protein